MKYGRVNNTFRESRWTRHAKHMLEQMILKKVHAMVFCPRQYRSLVYCTRLHLNAVPWRPVMWHWLSDFSSHPTMLS